MKKILNKRLETISAFVEDNTSVCDIGCDHGLLGIYLVLNRKNLQMMSSDINEKPLIKARENITKYQLEDRISLKQGNGLEVITKDVDTIVISGMGGISIIKILAKVNNYPNIQKLILSPNNDFPLVRKKITKQGFKITQEEMVYEKGKYYLVCVLERGHEKINYFFGRLDLNKKIVIDYYQNIYYNNEEIIKRLSFINRIKKLHLLFTNMKIYKKLKKLK